MEKKPSRSTPACEQINGRSNLDWLHERCGVNASLKCALRDAFGRGERRNPDQSNIGQREHTIPTGIISPSGRLGLLSAPVHGPQGQEVRAALLEQVSDFPPKSHSPSTTGEACPR